MMLKYSKKDIAIIAALAVITGIIFGNCFYPQSGIDPSILTDTGVHIDWARGLVTGGDYPSKIKTYPLTFIIIGVLGEIFNNYSVGATVFAVLFGIFTFFAQLFFLRKFMNTTEKGNWYLYLSSGLAFCLNFIWPLTRHFSRLALHSLYQNSFSTAPPHNLTQLSVKISAIFSLYYFYKVFEKKNDIKRENTFVILLSVFLFISVLFKPSFYQCFAPAGVIWTVVYFLINRNKEVFTRCLKVAIAYLPATIWMLYGMSVNVNKMDISPFEGITMLLNGTTLAPAIMKAIAFPLVLGLYLLAKKKFEPLYVLGVICFIMGLTEFILFIEPAEKASLNMSWGYQLGMYILFLTSIAVFYKLFPKLKWFEKAFGGAVIAMHTFIGVEAFVIWPSLFYILP